MPDQPFIKVGTLLQTIIGSSFEKYSEFVLVNRPNPKLVRKWPMANCYYRLCSNGSDVTMLMISYHITLSTFELQNSSVTVPLQNISASLYKCIYAKLYPRGAVTKTTTGMGLELLDWRNSSSLNVSLIQHMIFNTQCTYHMIYWYACIVSEIVSSIVDGYNG